MNNAEHANTTAQRILDAAERLFAENGGENGASMRMIADAAGVKLSLLTYHFGSKSDLYRSVFSRRAAQLADARASTLAELTDTPGVSLTLSDIVGAFVRPSIGLRYAAGSEGSAFAILTVYEAAEPREADRGILEEHYDPTAVIFIAALRRLYPSVDEAKIVDAYLFMVGALILTMASQSRFDRLHDRRKSGKRSTEELTQNLIDFCQGGVEGVLRT